MNIMIRNRVFLVISLVNKLALFKRKLLNWKLYFP